MLRHIGCRWWVIEIKDAQKLLWTKQIVDDYIEKSFLNEAPNYRGPE